MFAFVPGRVGEVDGASHIGQNCERLPDRVLNIFLDEVAETGCAVQFPYKFAVGVAFHEMNCPNGEQWQSSLQAEAQQPRQLWDGIGAVSSGLFQNFGPSEFSSRGSRFFIRARLARIPDTHLKEPVAARACIRERDKFGDKQSGEKETGLEWRRHACRTK